MRRTLTLLAVFTVALTALAVARPGSSLQLDTLLHGEAQPVGSLVYDGGASSLAITGGGVYSLSCGQACKVCTFGSPTSTSLDGGCANGEPLVANEKRLLVTQPATTHLVVDGSACVCPVFRRW